MEEKRGTVWACPNCLRLTNLQGVDANYQTQRLKCSHCVQVDHQRWERIERAAGMIATRMSGPNHAQIAAWSVDAAVLLIDEIDRRKAEGEGE